MSPRDNLRSVSVDSDEYVQHNSCEQQVGMIVIDRWLILPKEFLGDTVWERRSTPRRSEQWMSVRDYMQSAQKADGGVEPLYISGFKKVTAGSSNEQFRGEEL
eukprot:4813498-Amphidinium_carterae.2